jgi:hypothetical protein
MKKSERFIYIYFLLLPIIDLFTSLITRFTDISITPGIVFKGITLMGCIVYLFFFSKSKYKRKSIIYLFILLFFGIIYFFSKNYEYNINIIFNELKYAFKYFYFPVVLCGMINVFDDFEVSKKLIVKILVSNTIIYTFLMIVPYITSTGFNSYDMYWIYKGETGWFYSANEIGAILTLLAISIYYILNYRNKKYLPIIFLLMLSLAIIGTKVSFIGLVIMTILCLVATLLNQKKNAIKSCLFVIVFFIVSLFFSPTFDNFMSLKNNSNGNAQINNKPNNIAGSSEDNKDSNNGISDNIKDDAKKRFKELEDLIPIDFITNNLKLILSDRDVFLLDNLNVYVASNTEDKLFGLGWENRPDIDYTFSKKVIEIDVADIFVHYGIVGFFIYFLPLLYCFILGIKNIKFFNTESWLAILTFMLQIGISLLAGHILSAPTVSIYLILMIGLTMVIVRDNKELT